MFSAACWPRVPLARLGGTACSLCMLSAQFEVPSMTAAQTIAGIVIDITQVTPAALKSPFE